MDQFEILEKEVSAKTKIIEYLENELRSYSETVSRLINLSIKSEVLVNEKDNHSLLIVNKQYLELKDQFQKLKMKSKNYLKTIKLLESKNNEQSQQIENIELLNEKLKQSLQDVESEKYLLKRRLVEAIKQNEELELLKIAQAKVINELYLENLNPSQELQIIFCGSISIKNTFSLGHFKSLSIEEYETEFFKENYSFNQEISFNSSMRSGQHTNNTTIKNFQNLSLQHKKEGIIDACSSQVNEISKVFTVLENYNQQFSENICAFEVELNFLYEKIFRLTCVVQQMIEEKKRKTFKIKKFMTADELEREIENFMEKEEAYEGIVKELEEKLDLVLLEKRDLLAALSIEKEKNLGLSQHIDPLPSDFRMNPDIILSQDSPSDRIQQEIDSIKALAETEKNYFLDHIIMIEKENSNNLIDLTKQVSDLTTQIQYLERIYNEIELVLGKYYSGDLVKSIKSLVKKCGNKASGWNPFRRSQTKGLDSESPKSENDPVHFIVNKLKKQLSHEKKLHLLDKKQLESLREMLRHLEYERQIGNNEIFFKSLRMMVLDLCQNIPLQKIEIEKKIQTLLALIWLNKDEKIEMEKRKIIN